MTREITAFGCFKRGCFNDACACVQLLSLVHPVLDLLEDAAEEEGPSTANVQHAVAMILMHLAAVDAPREEREVGTLVDLLDQGPAPLCAAAAALWALVQNNQHNCAVAVTLGATEQVRSPSELLAPPSELLASTQRARSATQRALSVTQPALSVTQRALSVTQRARSVTQASSQRHPASGGNAPRSRCCQ